MKNLFIKLVAIVTVLTSGLAFATPAFAAGSFNPDPASNGVGILSVAISPNPSMGDYNTVSAQPGDTVSFNIYYHNNGNTAIGGTTIKFSPSSTGSSTSHTITGSLSGSGAVSITDTAHVTLSSSQTLTFIPGSARWYPNQTGQSSSGITLTSSQENALVGGSGFNIGTLNPGWPSQGGIVAKFKVSNTQVPPNCPSGTHLEGNSCVPDAPQGQKPSVTTYSATGLSDTSGSATLKGFVNPNGSSTSAWFKYRRGSGNWSETAHQSVGTTAQNIPRSITGLAAGTYEFQIVGENQFGTATGESKFFTINGEEPPCDPCDPCGTSYPCGTNDLPTVVTNSATGVSDDEATLRGSVNPNGSSTSAWFKYRRNNGSWIETAHQSVGSGSSSISISRSLSNLSDGDYEFIAYAENSEGTARGDSKFFEIGDEPSCDPCDPCGDDYPCNDGDAPSVDTNSPTNVDENSATLRGKLTDDGNDDNDVYFEWGTSSSNLNRTLDAGSMSNTGSFSKNLTGLNDDTRYYYKACAENSEDSDCGSIESFTTDSDDNDDDNDDEDDTDRADVTTLAATSIGSTVAIINGYYDSNGCSATTYFQYGRTNGFGSIAGSVSHSGDSSGGMAYVFSALAPSTTYYFRAVATNCEGTTYGVTRTFTTNIRTVIVDDTPVITIGGGGNAFIKLMIDNHRGTVRSGTDIAYDVSWENITNTTLRDLVLEVNFDSMTIIDTDMGNISRDGSSVFIEIDTLTGREIGEVVIVTQTKGFLKDGDPVVGQAILAFENPRTSATENAIAYDSDEFSTRGSVLGASIFGIGLPTSLGGWLLILLIILLIIILARHYLRQNRNQVVVNQGPMAPHPVDVAASPATGNDYIVYRPAPPTR